jgi:phenylpropionate dioxygenase-like ring-hydroxylating dioxygenase large terminal subunit
MFDTAALRELVKPAEGLVSARVFNDPDLYRLEVERIFARSWLFVAHESEIPRPGDFVTRSMGEDPVIVARGPDGRIRVLLNVCRHRGRKVCGVDAGRTATFRCGYHGWTYTTAGELTAVPFFEAYQGKLDKSALGLLQPARVDSYLGLVFATWDPEASPLAEYLGHLTWVLDLLFGRTERVEVAGPPIRWMAQANWKLGAANFVGDGLHVPITHGFSLQLGLHVLQQEGAGPPGAYKVCTEQGHGANLVGSPTGRDEPYFALPPALWPDLERRLTPEQRQVMQPLVSLAGTIFPNLSFLEAAGHTASEWGGPAGEAGSFLTLRQWQPRGPDRMEAWTWLFLDKTAPEAWQAMSRECYQRVFGVAGTFEQDDLENWKQITAGVRGPTARRLDLQYGMGLDVAPAPDWPGPGVAYYGRPAMFDRNELNFYQRWLALVSDGPADGQ